ncbi:MAG: hypothetical protein ACRD8Z_14130 [Nitrososphaeraceae archaeon]
MSERREVNGENWGGNLNMMRSQQMNLGLGPKTTIANIALPVEKRSRASTDADLIRLWSTTLEYDCTFGTLVVT